MNNNYYYWKVTYYDEGKLTEEIIESVAQAIPNTSWVSGNKQTLLEE